MEDGGIFALRLDGTQEPQLQPLDAVRDAVLDGWRAEATVTALQDQLAPQLDRLREGDSFDALGMAATEVIDLTRRGYRDDVPDGFIDRVFGMDEGAVEVIAGDGGVTVLRLQAIAPPPRMIRTSPACAARCAIRSPRISVRTCSRSSPTTSATAPG